MSSISKTAAFQMSAAEGRPLKPDHSDRTDLKAYEASRRAGHVDERNPQLLKAAQMYENQFLRHMLSEMRKTVPDNEFMPANQAEKIFREQLDDEYVDGWVNKGGIGMADMIYDQIMERYAHLVPGRAGAGTSAGTRGQKGFSPSPNGQKNPSVSKPSSPLSGDRVRTKILSNENKSGGHMSILMDTSPDVSHPKSTPQHVVAPWSGTVTALMPSSPGDGDVTLRLDHASGLKSWLKFSGVGSGLKVGSRVEEGQILGTVDPVRTAVTWQISDV